MFKGKDPFDVPSLPPPSVIPHPSIHPSIHAWIHLTSVVGRLHAGEGCQEAGCCHGNHWSGERLLCNLGAT